MELMVPIENKMNELTINLDSRSKKPLYEQIYDYIKSDIQNGRIPYGEKLPSTRALAKYLEVSRSTVELAYEQLLSEGYIESAPYRGFFVAQIDELYQLKKEEKKSERKIEKKKVYQYDFTPNGVDLNSFPYNVWRKLSKDILMDDRTELFRTGDPQGEYGFRSAISNYLYQARGVDCTPDQVLIGAGSDYILMLLGMILGTEHMIAFEDPTYKQAYRVIHTLGYETVPVAMDRHGMKIQDLESTGADIAYVTPSHQYPTGIVMPIGRRMELLKWAYEKDGRYIIEDDYDSEFRPNGKPLPTLFSMDACEKVIYMNTFSKTLCSTVRISYMVLPDELAERFYRELSFYSCTVSNFEQYTLAAFINQGYFEKHINRMQKYYLNKRDRLLNIIERSPLSSHVEISEKDSGLHFLMKIKTTLPDSEVVLKLQQNGIKVTALSQYYKETSNDSEHVFIINYSFVNEENLEMAVKTIYQSGILLTLS